MVSCYRDAATCKWMYDASDITFTYDIWLVNGHPNEVIVLVAANLLVTIYFVCIRYMYLMLTGTLVCLTLTPGITLLTGQTGLMFESVMYIY